MIRFRLLVLLPMLLGAAFAAAAQDDAPMESVAAVVNDEVITTYDVTQRMMLILATTNAQPTPELLARIQSEALRGLIDERIQLQEAAERELQISDEEVAAEIANLARQSDVTPQAIVQDLQSRGVAMSTLEQQLRAEIAWRILVNGLFRSRVRVSDDQIDEALARIAANADKPSYLIAEILISSRQMAGGDVQGVLQVITQQLQAGTPFQALARQLSSAPSRGNGGDVGWVREGELRHTEIDQALRGMQAGQIQAVPTREGLYVILLRDKRQGVELERLRLQQTFIAIPNGSADDAFTRAREILERESRRIEGCDNTERLERRLNNAIDDATLRVIISDLGAQPPSYLGADVRDAVTGLDIGATTTPIVRPTGVLALTLCERIAASPDALPSREDIENRLLDQQLSLYSRRYLRDLVDSATIETRLR